MDHDEYLLELCRYIVLNPVRAGMVATVVEWPWSSYAFMLSDSEKKAWLAVDAVLARFSSTKVVALKLYEQYVREGMINPKWELWRNIKNQIFLGIN